MFSVPVESSCAPLSGLKDELSDTWNVRIGEIDFQALKNDVHVAKKLTWAALSDDWASGVIALRAAP